MNMKKCVDGVYVEMTTEEIAALQQEERAAEQTLEERLAVLEAQMAERRNA